MIVVLLCAGFLLLPAACGGKPEWQANTTNSATPVQPTPLVAEATAAPLPEVEAKNLLLPPPPPPIPEDRPGASVEIFVYGYMSSPKAEDQWQRNLYQNLEKDIRQGLAKRKADTSSMVLIPAGQSILGASEPPRAPEERLPNQKVHVPAFYIDRTEVTNVEYQRCVAEKQCLPMLKADHISGHEGPKHPALITYKQAERYCLWAGKRLPAEYEWERAARGDDGRLYPWGNREPDARLANICGHNCNMRWAESAWQDPYPFTAPVDGFPAGLSPFGLYQMAGNVKEWVLTAQPLPSDVYIARGASWYSGRVELYAFYRQIWYPGVRTDDKGVRCVADAD